MRVLNGRVKCVLEVMERAVYILFYFTLQFHEIFSII